jgi:hypothetical protein
LIAEKRRRIEEMLWAIHEANIGDLWETYEAAKVGKDGKAETDESGNTLTVKKERPRLISELSPDIAKLIEDVTADSKGRLIPKLYSKLQASRELRQMLNIGRQKERPKANSLSVLVRGHFGRSVPRHCPASRIEKTKANFSCRAVPENRIWDPPTPPNAVLKTEKRAPFCVRNSFADGLLRAAQLSSAGSSL